MVTTVELPSLSKINVLVIGIAIVFLVIGVSIGLSIWEFSDMVLPADAGAAGQLAVVFDAPETARQGAEWKIKATIVNMGDGPAKGVSLNIPASNLIKGDQVGVSLLNPGKPKTVFITPEIKSTAPLGDTEIKAYISAEGLSASEQAIQVEIILPS